MHARIPRRTIWVLGCALMLLAAPAALLPTFAQGQGQGDDLTINNPDEYAWRLFVHIDQSANTGTNDVVWETWANQNEVYTDDPSTPPVWPDTSHRPKRLGPSLQHEVAGLPSGGPGQSQANGSPPGLDDVHLNRTTFDYVVANQLWFMQGVVAYVQQQSKLQFPRDAIAIKARWLVIKPSDKPRYHWQIYHDPKTGQDETVGLVALHIASKALPNWAWATFEQVDNPGRCDFIGCHDVFGQIPSDVPPAVVEGKPYPPEVLTPAVHDLMNAAGLGPEWQNYRLKSAQVDFTTSTGQPTLLGNSVTEAGFVQTSSCITCQARATVDTQCGSLEVFLTNQPPIGAVGAPDPSWYPTGSLGTPLFYQTDFLWELPLIASIAHPDSPPTACPH